MGLALPMFGGSRTSQPGQSPPSRLAVEESPVTCHLFKNFENSSWGLALEFQHILLITLKEPISTLYRSVEFLEIIRSHL